MTDARQQVERVLAESDQPADATAEEGLAPDIPPDRTRQFRYTNFSRMRMSWIGDDLVRLEEIQATANRALQARFKKAFDLMDEVWLCVREPLADESTGEIRLASDGRPRWREDEHGNPVENWGRLDDRTRERFLFAITTHLFEWETAAVDLWAEAMYSKVQWEEAFANGFIRMPGNQVSGRPTIDDRTQTGHAFSAQERYFAVFCSALSRKADALVRSLTRIQRLLENTTIR